MPRFIAAGLALSSTLTLAGCGALDPYPTAPIAATAGAAAGHRVAICYNTLKTTADEVRATAQQECLSYQPRTRADRVETDWHLQNCPLLLPARATFACVPQK